MILDAKKMPCPQPVLKTRDFLAAHPSCTLFTVEVDNIAAGENVLRFLESQGFSAKIAEKEGGFSISTLSIAPKTEWTPEKETEKHSTLLVITSDHMGQGDDLLGEKLMQNFIKTLPEMDTQLWRIIFLNSGVKLCIDSSPALSTLQDLEKQGVSILACGTCLEHYHLLPQKAVGQTTNMLDVVTSMALARKTIHI